MSDLRRDSDVRARMTTTTPDSKIASLSMPRHDVDFVSRLLAVPDVSSAVADALDELGVGFVLDSTALRPITPGIRLCGQAVTLRYIPLDGDVSSNRDAGRGRIFGDRDLYGLGRPGDVAVMDCSGSLTGAVMGALSARWAIKAGIAGCVVDGSVRDTDSIRSSKLPVFSSAANPAAARYRYEIAEMNGPVTVRGCTVEPGDYVVADGDGICIVPFADVRRVVEHCETAHRAEIDFVERIDNATTLEELVAGLTSGTTPA
ncbi:RraA family protein [Rhodococcoides fascians]|uniref:RraA family protein n=1 Tax=Rhodococcoides fascians TaxID=1828 RepID=UPI00055AAC7B|nr:MULTISPECIES: RraA family protein [Rhodococcus]OZF04820.1 methyltransferase [Rhodococcus sp. 15-1189-1-1a]OZF19084.1 methyltransferase [Rhodococcus sp. 14-2686-1-2]